MSDNGIQQANQQVQRARQQIEVQRQKQREQIKANEAMRSRLTSVQAVRNLSGIEGLRQRQQQLSRLSSNTQQVRAREQVLTQYEKEVINPAQQELDKIAEEQRAFNLALRALNSDSGAMVKGLETYEPKAFEYYQQLRRSSNTAEAFNDKIKEAIAKFNTGMSKEEAFKGLNLADLEKQGVIKFSEIQTTTTKEIPSVTVTSTPQPVKNNEKSWLERAYSKFFMGADIRDSPFTPAVKIYENVRGGLKDAATPQQKLFFRELDNIKQPIINKATLVEEKITKFVMPSSSQQIGVEKRLETLNKISASGGLNQNQLREYQALTQKQARLQQEFQRTPVAFFGAAAGAAATTPLFVARSVISPKVTTAESFRSVLNVPSAFVKNPLGTAGSIVGSVIGGELIGRAIPKTTTTRRVIKPQAETTIDLSDAIQISENKWSVRGKATTNVLDPVTKNVINRVSTESRSFVVVAQNEGEALRAAAETAAASIGKSQTRTYNVPETKITQKFDLSTGRGTITLTEAPNTEGLVMVGTGETNVLDWGTYRQRATSSGVTGKVTSSILKPESTILSNIKTQQVAEGFSTRTVGKVSIEGEQMFFKNMILSDVYPETLRVKGYFKSTGERISPYLRSVRVDTKYPIMQRELSAGLGSSFTPTALKLKFGESTKPFSTKSQILLSETKQAQAAQAAASTQVQAIIKAVVEPKVTKPITKTKTTISPILSVGQRTSAGLFAGLGQYERTEEKAAFMPSVKSQSLQSNILATQTRTEQIQPFSFKGAVIPNVTEGLTSKESQQLREGQIEATSQKEVLRSRLAQRVATITANKTAQRNSIVKIKPKKKFLDVSEDGGISRKEKIIDFLKSRKSYNVFLKRRGKDILIGKEPSVSLAAKKLKFALKESLAASGFVEEGSRKVQARELGLSREFLPSKKSPFRLVQQRGFRLGTRGERKEILFAKRKKSNFSWLG